MKTKFSKIVDNHILYGKIAVGDSLYYCWYYKNKDGQPYGNWMGLGWYTTISHAVRGLRRALK